MKTEKIPVSRTIEAGTTKTERKTMVSFRQAESVEEMLTLSGGKLADVLRTFNGGRWAEFRTKVSNTLAGTSEAQRSIAKMVKAFQALNPKLSEDEVKSLVLAMPGIADAAGQSVSPLPEEIDDTYNFGATTEEQAAA